MKLKKKKVEKMLSLTLALSESQLSSTRLKTHFLDVFPCPGPLFLKLGPCPSGFSGLFLDFSLGSISYY
jgi:hypothetical protein